MFLISFLIFVLPQFSSAKFSEDIKFDPCQEVKLEISHCEPHAESNKEYVEREKSHFKDRPDLLNGIPTFEYKGVKITAKIVNQNPIPCNKSQVIKLEREKKIPSDTRSFFVVGPTCDEIAGKKSHVFFRKNFYCDTPGTESIESCFVQTFGNKVFLLFNALP